jgi:hypothetical protein
LNVFLREVELNLVKGSDGKATGAQQQSSSVAHLFNKTGFSKT